MPTRWKIFTVLALAYVIAYFYRVAMAVVAKDVALELGLDAAQLGVLSGVLFYAFALMQLPLGPLLDRFGGKKILLSLSVATLAGSCLFALADSFGAAVAARVLLGVGTSCVLMGSYRIFVGWFSPREFVVVSGLIMAVGNLGNLAATTPLAMAVSRYGWRTAFIFVAVLQLAVILLVSLVVKEHPPDQEKVSSPPERVSIFGGWMTVFRAPSFWCLALLSFFWYGNYMVIQGLWGGPYLMEVMGMSREEAGNLLLFTAVGYIIGSLAIGKMSNDLFRSRKWTLIAGQISLLVIMSFFLGPLERLSLSAMRGVFLAAGLAVSSGVMIYPMAREMFPENLAATAMTAANFFVLTGAAVVQQAVGLVIKTFPKAAGGYPPAAYHTAFLLPVCGLLFAVILFAFAPCRRA